MTFYYFFFAISPKGRADQGMKKIDLDLMWIDRARGLRSTANTNVKKIYHKPWVIFSAHSSPVTALASVIFPSRIQSMAVAIGTCKTSRNSSASS